MKEKYHSGIEALIEVYNIRPDLQKAFPEVIEGNLNKLVAWALEYGTNIDAFHDKLKPYIKEFREYDQKKSKSVFTWDNSTEHYISDGFKIYWETLSQIGLYQYECISGDKNIDMLSYTMNLARKHFPNRKLRAGFIGCHEAGMPELKFYESDFCSEIVVMDIAKGLLEKQQQKCIEKNIQNIKYLHSDFNKIVFIENEFDFINAWGTVHHIENLEHFFSQAQKGLKKEGIMVVREYVGPNYLQFTDEQLNLVGSILKLLPKELRLYQNKKDFKTFEFRINKKKLLQVDPSEAVRSADILKVIEDYFEIIEFHKTGGTILHPLLNGIADNFEKSNEGREVLQTIIDIEKSLINANLLPSDYVYFVVKPKK